MPGKGKQGDKAGPHGKSPHGHKGKEHAAATPIPESVVEPVPEPPPMIEPPKEPVFTDVELFLKEIEATQIARPKRVRSRELASLLPYYKVSQEPLLFRIISERLALCDSMSHAKDQIALDLYCQVINQATELQLNFEQTSAMFSIVKNVHEMAIETPVDNTQECLEYMDNMLCRHIVKVCMDLKIEYKKSAVKKPSPPFPDPRVRNPMINKDLKDVALADVLKEIDLEEQVEKDIAEDHPLYVAPVAPSPDLTVPEVPRTAEPPLDPRLTELEGLVAHQMDEKLKVLREKITDKLRQVDEMLKKATGIPGPIDQFSLSDHPAAKAAALTEKAEPAGKKKPKK
ncbi:hypothetical protein BV898_07726 [Hypsibius exemplaris]|uniref:Uncharacterized protein n=1 Tax=Hypsibius exemplaris TaxID=2072580 RepID=A0A1W0WSE9_HYPEX|nr:hypothetical protein BV898_07726 [Hypsibius exemplaris]